MHYAMSRWAVQTTPKRRNLLTVTHCTACLAWNKCYYGTMALFKTVIPCPAMFSYDIVFGIVSVSCSWFTGTLPGGILLVIQNAEYNPLSWPLKYLCEYQQLLKELFEKRWKHCHSKLCTDVVRWWTTLCCRLSETNESVSVSLKLVWGCVLHLLLQPP